MAHHGGKSEVPKFIHRINRKEGEQLLMTKGEHGSFLVRTSESNSNKYSISYRETNSVKHIQFEAAEEGFTVNCLPDGYATIGDLVTALQRSNIGAPLDYPVWPSDPAPDGLNPRLFFGRLTANQTVRTLLDQNVPLERNFLIRSSTSKYDQFVFSVRMPENDVVHLLVHFDKGKYFFKGEQNSRKFNSFKELFDYYTNPENDPVTHSDGRTVQLHKPLVCKWQKDYSVVKIDRSKKLPNSEIAAEFELLQSLQATSESKSEIGRKPENVSKNRYKNILPYDETRVILKSGSDYINANYLKTDEPLGAYIGCQGPLPNTAVDFWRMVWQEKSQFIVMLTNTVEGGKNKCNQYWSKDRESEMMFDHIRVLTQERITANKDYIITRLMLKKEDSEQKVDFNADETKKAEERMVYHCHYIGWPDKTVPKNVDSLVKFTMEILHLRQSTGSSSLVPIIAHCSAGIGRTGTYILISMIIQYIQMFGSADVPDIFKYAKIIRQQRPGMVQTVQQYDLVYKAIEIYLNEFSEPVGASYGNLPSTTGPVYGNI